MSERGSAKQMKNACVVLNNGRNDFSPSDILSVTERFRSGGYAFVETRVLVCAEDKKIKNALCGLKEEYENFLVLTNAEQYAAVENILSGLFQQQTFQTATGTGIFGDGQKTLFLLSKTHSDGTSKYVQETCLPFLDRKYGVRRDKLVIRAVGANETRVESLIARAEEIAQGKINCFHTRKFDEDVVEIVYGENVSKMLADDVLRIFAEGLSDTVYALDDTPLAKQLVQLLKIRGRKISVAESFTGGGIAKRIVSVSGASEVYFEGLNTYDEVSKIKRLGVSEYTLKTVGAVSDQTAYEMAAGLIATGDCDVSIATTGLAGPNTDRSMLPVGLCYIAVGTKERVFVYRYKFDGDRETITETAINYALFLAYKQLKNM